MKIEINAETKDLGIWIMGFIVLMCVLLWGGTSINQYDLQQQKRWDACAARNGDYVRDTLGNYRCEVQK